MTTEADIPDIDLPTGLPKLSIELLPDSEEENKPWSKYTRHDSFDRLPVRVEDMAAKLPRHKTLHLSREQPEVSMDLRHSSSSPECRQRSFSGTTGTGSAFNRHARQRSSLFIKLHRTSTVPQRLSILTENNTVPDSVHTAPVPAGNPDSQFSFPDGQFSPSPGKQSSSTPDLLSKSSSDESTPTVSSSPSTKRLGSTGRRNSFLYEADGGTALPFPHSSSMTSHMEETFVTPFAQILATMHKVRESFVGLMGLPEDARRHAHHSPMTPNSHRKPPLSPFNRKLSLDASRQYAMATLEQIDWCLQQLESVDSAKAMGGPLAQDKFHRLLTRELSNMSEHSRSGNKLAEWVHDITSSANERSQQVDRALNQESSGDGRSEEMHMQPRLSGSMSHDVWRKRALVRSSTGTQIQLKLGEDCERVPTFGVTNPKMDITQMRKFMYEEAGLWSPDVFKLDEISARNSLVCAAYNIFKTRLLSCPFEISPPTFINFMLAIQNRYHSTNPYHNHIHAADVLLTTDFLLKAKPLENVFSKLEVFAALVAAAVHDVDHPGRSNQFLIETNNSLAVLYNDNSVLENHHLAVAFQTLAEPGCNFLEYLDKEQTKAFRKMVIDMVLATDMSVHFKHLAELKTLLETKTLTNDGILELDTYQERSELLQCLIHCADLSNPAKAEELAVNWSNRIMQETFQQGDEERSRGIPVNPLGDREQVSVAKCQVTFIDLIVYPLFETWSDLVYPEAQHILDNLSSTRQYWATRITSSPPPTSPTPTSSPTPTTTPTTPSDSIAAPRPMEADAISFSSNLHRVSEECVMTEDTPLHSANTLPPANNKQHHPPPVSETHAESPAAKDRRNSYKSFRDKEVDEER